MSTEIFIANWGIISPRYGSREDDMVAIIAVGLLAAIWIVVLWGSAYINKNIQ